MWWQLFTHRFRVRLRVLARNAAGREARVLAAKVSPLLSVFGALFTLQYFPGYGYAIFASVVVAAVALGAIVAYSVPGPFIMLLRLIAADQNDFVLWGKHKKGTRNES